jgi:predicted membrane protein
VGSGFGHRDDATPSTHDRPPDAPVEVSESVELRKEAWVMALYVAVCLLAALSAVAEQESDGHVRAIAIVWGTTVGLALAHAFAFRVSARIVAQGRIRRHDADAIIAQLVGATGVAVLATIPILLWPATAEFDVVRWTLAVFISLVGFQVARSSGAGRGRSLVYGAALLATAVTIAVAKNILSGH